MTEMMNMAINDMELDNVTGGATRTVKNNSLKYANIREGDRQQNQERRLCMV